MKIVKVQYTLKEDGSNHENNFKVTFDNNMIAFVGKNEDTHISDKLNEWITAGKTITAAGE
tara:strand:+ start:710 stop:892 length:183 start_codon:yes stop_codon:yes gene_type:complete